MFENLKNWLINMLGGYTYEAWVGLCNAEDRKHLLRKGGSDA